MTRYDWRTRAFATCLAAVAGFVDATAFLKLGGFFVSFMSGNSTRLGVGLAKGATAAPIAAGLILTFVIGVIAGSLLGRAAGPKRRVAVIGFVTLLLCGAAAVGAHAAAPAMILMALAMGAENAIFERDGEVSIGLTYMTGALVKVGQRIAAALCGGDRLAWLSYLLLWMGLVGGAVCGALAYAHLGLAGLWIAAASAAGLTLAAVLMRLDSPDA